MRHEMVYEKKKRKTKRVEDGHPLSELFVFFDPPLSHYGSNRGASGPSGFDLRGINIPT